MVSYYINDEHVRKEEFEQSLKDNLYESIKREYFFFPSEEEEIKKEIEKEYKTEYKKVIKLILLEVPVLINNKKFRAFGVDLYPDDE